MVSLLASTEVGVPADPVVKRAGDRPNVVLVVTDDQRADTIAGMPAVQRLLVRKGVQFSNGMVPTALCCPSRASILTGLYAHNSRVFGNGDIGGNRYGGWAQFHRRGMEFRTIATALEGRGYRNGLFGKYINNFGNSTPDDFVPPGWDTFTAFQYARGAYFGYRLTDGTRHGYAPEDYSTDVLTRRVNSFIRTTPKNRPLFVYFAPFAPHDPYTPAPRHKGTATNLPSLATFSPPGGTRAAWRRGRPVPPVEEADLARRGQVETLLSVDDAVAGILRTLRRTGRQRDTLFIFTSDNGYLWGEHGLIGKDAPYAPATRIPLVLRWDGHAPAGVVDERLALNIDLASTIARAAGAPMSTDGVDLLGSARRKGFVLEAMDGYRGRPAYCGWRTKRRMYVRWATGRTELYDYRTDPAEERNLAGLPKVKGVQQRMRAKARAACVPEPPGFSW